MQEQPILEHWLRDELLQTNVLLSQLGAIVGRSVRAPTPRIETGRYRYGAATNESTRRAASYVVRVRSLITMVAERSNRTTPFIWHTTNLSRRSGSSPTRANYKRDSEPAADPSTNGAGVATNVCAHAGRTQIRTRDSGSVSRLARHERTGTRRIERPPHVACVGLARRSRRCRSERTSVSGRDGRVDPAAIHDRPHSTRPLALPPR